LLLPIERQTPDQSLERQLNYVLFLHGALDEFWRKIHQAQNPTEIARVKPRFRCELLLRIDFTRHDPFSPAMSTGNCLQQIRVRSPRLRSSGSQQQAKLALEEAVAGYTAEERGVAKASVVKADAAIATLQAQVAEMTVKAPVAAQVYVTSAEVGEFVSPGVPLLSLVDLSDLWLRFDLREDLVKGLKIGDRFEMRVPALGDKLITGAIRRIATRGEYAGWRATRATGDFDLRTFEIRAYPVEPLPELRPGMSVLVAIP